MEANHLPYTDIIESMDAESFPAFYFESSDGSPLRLVHHSLFLC